MMKEVCAAIPGFFAAAAFAAVCLPLWMIIDTGYISAGFLLAPVWFFPIALIVVLALGVPTFLLLRPFKPGHWSLALVIGAILGELLTAVLPMPKLVPLSALSALVFWLVWRRIDESDENKCACA